MKILLLLVISCIALSSAGRTTLLKRSTIPPKWTMGEQSSHGSVVTFFIALRQQNLDKLESIYWDRTNPMSPNYRQWMTIEEINEMVAPPSQVVDKVMSWLNEHGITHIKSYGDSIEVTAPVGLLKDLFNTDFYQFTHVNGRTLARQYGELSVPSEIAENIYMIAGLSNFPRERDGIKKQKRNGVKRQFDWDTYIVPQSVWGLYSIPSGTMASSNTSQGVIEWEDQYYSPQDLAGFATNMAVPNLSPLAPIHVIGQNDPSSPQDEAQLDIEWIAATGINAQNWFWLEGDVSWLYGFSIHFMNTPTVPLVISMSYGWNEEDQCEIGIGGDECNNLGVNSTQYVQRVNVEFQKIGLRGVSIFASSGDSGANGRTDESCTESNFNPAFPAASPFVTAVGATQLTSARSNLSNPPPVCNSDFWFCASGGTETAVSYSAAGFTSGGGFSNVAPMPSWQTKVVNAYLQTSAGKEAPASYYNRNGRAYPDISALGSRILIWLGGTDVSVGGTSCSSPMSAGIFTLLNDYAIKRSGKPLGPVNQLIYQMAAANPSTFQDITVGDNSCTESGCGIPIIAPCYGYYATTGWDAVTGLGTPNYSQMLAYLKTVIG